jgi:hypothetical protein
MRIPKGKLKELSENSGIRANKLCSYASTSLRPSRKRALHLEATTGIPAALWLLGTSTELKQAIAEAGEVA